MLEMLERAQKHPIDVHEEMSNDGNTVYRAIDYVPQSHVITQQELLVTTLVDDRVISSRCITSLRSRSSWKGRGKSVKLISWRSALSTTEGDAGEDAEGA